MFPTQSAKWPKGGCIMAVRSSDNGQRWSKPLVVMDTDQDDPDPSVACLKDGTLLLNWFTLQPTPTNERSS
jgi:sialidase-1